jgi:hypothetical protein
MEALNHARGKGKGGCRRLNLYSLLADYSRHMPNITYNFGAAAEPEYHASFQRSHCHSNQGWNRVPTRSFLSLGPPDPVTS